MEPYLVHDDMVWLAMGRVLEDPKGSYAPDYVWTSNGVSGHTSIFTIDHGTHYRLTNGGMS